MVQRRILHEKKKITDNPENLLYETAFKTTVSSVRGFFRSCVIQTATGDPSCHSHHHLQQLFEDELQKHFIALWNQVLGIFP